MPDRRTKRQKLEAMARQSVSPHEAEIAQAKLQGMVSPHHSSSRLTTEDILRAATDLRRGRKTSPRNAMGTATTIWVNGVPFAFVDENESRFAFRSSNHFDDDS